MTYEEQINIFISLLNKWNKKINLVSNNSLSNVITRHIEDSLQLKDLIDKNCPILDIGSGAGFPGIILSIYKTSPVYLCENCWKKIVFLKEVKRLLNLDYVILNKDIYKLSINNIKPNTIAISRAFGNLCILLQIMDNLKIKKGIFHKGKRYQDEVQFSQKYFFFYLKIIPSKINKDSVLLIVSNVIRLTNSLV